MTAYHDFVGTPFGTFLQFLAIWLVVGQSFVLLQAIRYRRPKRYGFLMALHFALGMIPFFLILGIFYEATGEPFDSAFLRASQRFYELPWLVIAVGELVSTILFLLSFWGNVRYRETWLTPSTIKEAMDYLPVGVCFSNENGVVLSNLRMNEAVREVTGEPLTDAKALWESLEKKGEGTKEEPMVFQTDKGVWLFAKTALDEAGENVSQLTATDVSEIYRVTEKLKKQNERLRDIHLRMLAYSAETTDLAMDQEILAARVAVHDEVGHVLLRGSYFLEHPDNADGMGVLAMLRQTNETLLYEAENPEDVTDPVEAAVRMAKAIGVEVKLPEISFSEAAATLLGQAIRECAANTVKHADGDALEVSAFENEEEIRVTLTNNGMAPEKEVAEAGGLLSLRRTAEKLGASMKTESFPRFRLSINFPKKIFYPVQSDGDKQ